MTSVAVHEALRHRTCKLGELGKLGVLGCVHRLLRFQLLDLASQELLSRVVRGLQEDAACGVWHDACCHAAAGK